MSLLTLPVEAERSESGWLVGDDAGRQAFATLLLDAFEALAEQQWMDRRLAEDRVYGRPDALVLGCRHGKTPQIVEAERAAAGVRWNEEAIRETAEANRTWSPR